MLQRCPGVRYGLRVLVVLAQYPGFMLYQILAAVSAWPERARAAWAVLGVGIAGRGAPAAGCAGARAHTCSRRIHMRGAEHVHTAQTARHNRRRRWRARTHKEERTRRRPPHPSRLSFRPSGERESCELRAVLDLCERESSSVSPNLSERRRHRRC